MSTPGVTIDATGKKTFVPLENNPEVLTRLMHTLTGSDSLTFHDVYSLDEPDLLALVPRPAHALVFIAPAPIYHLIRESTPGSATLAYSGAGPDEPVLWFKQTIGHACGLIALIHSLANGTARPSVKPDSILGRLLVEAEPLQPLPRAAVLYDSLELERAHMEAARRGDSAEPSSREACGYHFISFVKGKDGHLWELEGGWGGPIDLGPLREDEDVMSERALDAGVRRFVRAADGNLEFSIVALTGDPKPRSEAE